MAAFASGGDRAADVCAPDWLPRSIVILLAIGFIPAIIFAWAFELTPTGLKRDEEVTPAESIAPQTARRMNRLIIVVLVLALAYFCFDKIVLTPRREAALVAATEKSVAARPSPETKAAVNPKSIAVLPFVNMSADAGNQYFSDGISEELLNALVHVDGIGVASRTSSFAYKGSGLGATAIANTLKVRYIVEGSVRKSGDRVRITAQLIDATQDRQLFSETYDRQLTDIFAIQEEIANAVVSALRGTLGEAKPAVKVRADTDNLEAYDLYLKARELFIARKDLQESIRLFQRVVEMDPKFARGWEGMAAVCAVANSWGIRDRDYLPIAKSAAERALELDSTLSMPWAALSYFERKQEQVDWEKSLELTDRAIAADPKNATAYLWRSIDWMNLGFFQRAMADQDRALALDPAYPNCTRWKALALLFNGQTEEALSLFERGPAAGFTINRSDSFVAPLLQRGHRVAALLLINQQVAKLNSARSCSTPQQTPGCPIQTRAQS
ncbi:MAG: hypothetical protein H0T83_05495 [Chthoniobacterales bacterium]|nr:hypothetical protein [Chthoniobacterales bacterium]